MLAEVFGGIISGSLALLADAGHMFTDFAALFMAWVAFRMARRPANQKQTFGFERMQILVAFVNGLSLFFISGLIVKEAIERFLNPVEVFAPTMMIIAALGFVVNIIVFYILHSAESDNLNMRGAIIHVIGDLLGSVVALVAGIVIYYTGYHAIDPILSLFVALILVRSAWFVTRESAHILLEHVPDHIDLKDVRTQLLDNFSELEDIHHLHAWSITQERVVATMHAKVSKPMAPENIVCRIKQYLYENFKIDHATIEVEFELCADVVLPTLSDKTPQVDPCCCLEEERELASKTA